MLRLLLLAICAVATLISNFSLDVSPLYLVNFCLLALLLFLPAREINAISHNLSHITPVSILFILTLWFALSQFWSQAGASTQTFFYTFDLILLSALVNTTLTVRQRQAVYSILIGIGVLIALYTLFLTLSQGVLFPRIFFVHKNNYAGFLVLLLLPVAALLLSARTKSQLLVFGFLCATLVMSLTIAQSRGAFLGFIIGLVTLITLYKQRRYFFHLLGWLAFGIIAALFITPTSTSLANKFASNISLDPTSSQAINPRIDIWASALEMYKQFPLFGWGGGTFKIAYPPFRPPEFFPTIYNAHNDYLHMLVELGPIGLITLLTLVGVVLHRGRKLSGTADAQQSALYSGITAALAGLFCQMLFTSSLYAAPLGVIAGTYIGGLSGAGEHISVHRLQLKTILLKGFIAFLFLQLVSITTSDYFMLKARSAATAESRLALLESAARWNPSSDAPHYLQADLVANLLAQQINVSSRTLNAALTELDQAQTLMPLRRQTYWLRSHLLQHVQPVPYRKIEQNYSRALSLNPKFLRARIEYAAIIEQQGDIKRACRVLEQGIGESYYTRRATLLEYAEQLQQCHKANLLNSKLRLKQNIQALEKSRYDIILYRF